MIALSNEVEQMNGSIDVSGNRGSQIRVEIGEPRAVDYQIQVRAQTIQSISLEPKPWSGHIALDDFDSIAEELREIFAVAFVKGFEDRRLFNNLLEAALCARRTRAPYQEIDFSNLGHIIQDLAQPNLSDEAGDSYQKDILARERL